MTARVPAANATGVAVGANISATFSEPVQGVTPANFTVRQGANPVLAGTVTQVGTTNEWALNPTADLAFNTVYTVTLTGNATTGIRDAVNNPLATTTWTFTTAAAPDTLAPTVTARVPATGATGVAVGADLSATFSEAVQGVSTGSFTVRAGAAAAVAATVTAGPGANQFTLNPTANLAAATVYTATLTGGAAAIRDLAGNPLTNVTWTFTTAAAGDTTAPTVGSQSPANNATGVAVASNITATFSEAVTGVTTAGNVTVRVGTLATGTLVPSAVTYNAATRVMTINPTANLAADTRYTVRLTGGIRDAALNALVPTSWTFLTGAVPVITARAPANNATGASLTANLTVTFSEAVNGVSGTTFVLRRPDGSTFPSVVSRNGTTNQWILNPTGNLLADTRYTVVLTGGTAAIRDLAGNPLVTPAWTFLTGPVPTVTTRTPAVGATGASRTANITTTLSEAPLASSVNATNRGADQHGDRRGDCEGHLGCRRRHHDQSERDPGGEHPVHRADQRSDRCRGQSACADHLELQDRGVTASHHHCSTSSLLQITSEGGPL